MMLTDEYIKGCANVFASNRKSVPLSSYNTPKHSCNKESLILPQIYNAI